MDIPEADQFGDRAARQLAAMRLLLDAKRDRQQNDVLLATIFEALSDGMQRTTDELLRQAQADWPGVVVPRSTLVAALTQAAERGFLVKEMTLGQIETWAITPSATIGVADSKSWARDVLDRCQRQVEDRAREHPIPVSPEQSALWTGLLLEVLHEGITTSITQERGNIREFGRRLFPPYDRQQIVDATRLRVDDPEVAEFLSALALAALDPASTFGSEVVHYLATGYILYGLMLGVDVASERSELADFSGEVLLLDTPVLLRLLGGGTAYRGMTDLVGRVASEAGAVVAVASRTRVEFADMLQRRDDDARKIESELRDGVPRENLAAVAPDEVLVLWLEEPHRPSWEQFCAGVDTVMTTLASIGVTTDYAPEGYERDSTRCEEFSEAVKAVTRERGKERHQIPAQHDGEILGFVEHLRSIARSTRGQSIWPGAFVMTTDRSLSSAYRRVVDAVDAPVALSISQAAAVLARMAQPHDAERMAGLIAEDLQWQARFERATAFGIDEAIELARSFGSNDPDGALVEAESVELTLEGLLQEADFDGDPDAAVRAAIIQQARRRRAAGQDHRNEYEKEATRQRERALREQTRSATLAEVNRVQAQELGAARTDGAEHERALAIDRRRSGVWITYLVAALVLVLAVALGLTSWAALAIPGLLMAAALPSLLSWADDPNLPANRLAIGAVGWVAAAVLSGWFFS